MKNVSALLIVSGLMLASRVALAQPPANDSFSAAAVISALPFTTSEVITEATFDVNDPNTCFAGAESVWFKFTPTQNLTVVVDTTGSVYNAVLGVFTGTPGALTNLGCAESSFVPAQVTFHATAGQTYYFMIATPFEGTEGTLHLKVFSVIPPANDENTSPTVITGIPASQRQDTTQATPGGITDICGGNIGHTVWYSFTPSKDIRLQVDTAGSDYDTILGIESGPAASPGFIGCNDDFNSTIQSRFTFDAKAGVTYLFMVGSVRDTPGGNLVLNVKQGLPFVPLNFTVVVDRFGSLGGGGTATVTGKITCNKLGFVSMDADLKQQIGRFFIRQGHGSTAPACLPSQPVAWSMQFFDDHGGFLPFPAKITVNVFGCDPEDGNCLSKQFKSRVLLRRPR